MAGPNFGSANIATEGAIIVGPSAGSIIPLPGEAISVNEGAVIIGSRGLGGLMPGDKFLITMGTGLTTARRLFSVDEFGSVNMTQASGTGDPVLNITNSYRNRGLNIFQGGPNDAIYVEKAFVAEDPSTPLRESAGSCIYAYQQGDSPAIKVNVTNRGGEGILMTCHSNKTALDISSNGGFNAPQVFVNQTRPNDFARVRFGAEDLPLNDHWDIAVGGVDNQMRFFHRHEPNWQNIMTLDAGGRVGIRTTKPKRVLTVNGSIGSPVATYHSSDIRMKQNITPIEQPLDKVRSIRGVKFEWRREDFPDINFPEGTQLGVIGQEVGLVLPEVVDQDEDGHLSVQYEGLIPVLIEAIKEQQEEIEDLKSVVKSLMTEKPGAEEKSE